jgi:hypothetical protein
VGVRTVALAGAVTSTSTGLLGLLIPDLLASAVGIDPDAVVTTVIRLVCAAYLGYGLLAWSARNMTDVVAWRAIAIANAVSWGLSACALAIGLASGVGAAWVWTLVAMQVAFAVAWASALVRTRRFASRLA